jgi:outer membrane protein assembly factor BamB
MFALATWLVVVLFAALPVEGQRDDGAAWPGLGGNAQHTGSSLAQWDAASVGAGMTWKFRTDGYMYSTPAIGSDHAIYVVSDDGNLYALDPLGNSLWVFQMGALTQLQAPALAAGIVYVSSFSSWLYAVSMATGDLQWYYGTGSAAAVSPVVASDGMVFFGSTAGMVHALFPNGTAKWVVQVRGR